MQSTARKRGLRRIGGLSAEPCARQVVLEFLDPLLYAVPSVVVAPQLTSSFTAIGHPDPKGVARHIRQMAAHRGLLSRMRSRTTTKRRASVQPKSCTVNWPAWRCSSMSFHALLSAHFRWRFLVRTATTEGSSRSSRKFRKAPLKATAIEAHLELLGFFGRSVSVLWRKGAPRPCSLCAASRAKRTARLGPHHRQLRMAVAPSCRGGESFARPSCFSSKQEHCRIKIKRPSAWAKVCSTSRFGAMGCSCRLSVVGGAAGAHKSAGPVGA